MSAREPHRVVIVGGGFAGVRVANKLAGEPDVAITLIDRANHHLFQPLLYQVATGELSEGQIAPALRGMFRGKQAVRLMLGEVESIDLEGRTVRTAAAETADVPYDTLVVAVGSVDSYFGHDEWARNALAMKTIDDAERIRSRILAALEMAEETPAGPERDAWLTYALVGAGPSGVELAGQISLLTHRVVRDEYRLIDPATAKIILLDAADDVLPAMHPSLQRHTHRDLVDRLGIDVRPRHSVVGVDDHGLDVDGPDGRIRIPARTILWSAGVQAAPLARALGAAAGLELGKGGRIPVAPDLTLPGHPEVFAVGDMVDLDGVPGLAPAAIQQGVYVAKVIRSRLHGKPAPTPFRYVDKGTLAVIGRDRAVADIKGIRLHGPIAFAVWAVVHLFYLVGWGNRIGTVYRWLWSLLARNRQERVISVSSLVRDDDPRRSLQSELSDAGPE
jgi:NADH:ubiquinone reductase (H+-translocating)